MLFVSENVWRALVSFVLVNTVFPSLLIKGKRLLVSQESATFWFQRRRDN